ncbi:MAG TPA: glutathione S-transferase [Stenotrophomonas sp.]|nr:glutathione S-transferase [Stenotrophomonas sp.]
MLELFGQAASINVRKVLWTLDELGLVCQRHDVGGAFASPDTPQFRAMNPNAQVPVLRDGDLVLWESNTICRYLAGRAGRDDLLPSAPAARAMVEQWMDWQATDLNTAWRYAFMARVRHSPRHDDPAAIAESAGSWNRLMGILDGQLARTGAHVAGRDFTLADIVIGLSVQRWLHTPIERPSLSAVMAYYARLQQRPAFVRHGANGLP